MSDNDLMSDLEAAFDQLDDEATDSEETEVIETTSEETTDDSAVVDEVETETTETPEEETAPDVEATAEEKPPEEAEETPAKIEKAPASWSPKAREAWGKVPAEAQAQVAKREAEVNQVLQNSAEARKAVAQFDKVLSPYKDGLMAAGHADPFTAINSVLGTEQALRSGNPQEKAYKVAELIKQYGVDIGQLDSVLAGQPVAPAAQQEQFQDPRLDALLAQMQQQEEQQTYQGQQQAQQSVQEFREQAEFFEDVRLDMADMMDLATKHGRTLDMQEAYDKACAIHPEISGIVAQRNQEARLLESENVLEAKRTAAGASLVGRKTGQGGSEGNLDLRGQIEAAWGGE